MKTIIILLTFIYSVFSVDAYGQTEITVGNKTFIKSYHKNGSWRIVNKASVALYESTYRAKERGNNATQRYEATNNLKVYGNNAVILNAVRSTFSSMELSLLKDQNLSILLKINKQGTIFYVHFSYQSARFNTISLPKFSFLEDKLKSTMTFKIPDQSIDVYTIVLNLDFNKVYNNTFLFPETFFVK